MQRRNTIGAQIEAGIYYLADLFNHFLTILKSRTNIALD